MGAQGIGATLAPLDHVLAFVYEVLREIEKEEAMLEGVDGDTSLLRSGLFDSHSTLWLAAWIEEQLGRDLDLTGMDLAQEWDTPAQIAAFIERHR